MRAINRSYPESYQKGCGSDWSSEPFMCKPKIYCPLRDGIDYSTSYANHTFYNSTLFPISGTTATFTCNSDKNGEKSWVNICNNGTWTGKEVSCSGMFISRRKA